MGNNVYSHINGFVNKQIILGTKNLRIVQIELHCLKVKQWCVIKTEGELDFLG